MPALKMMEIEGAKIYVTGHFSLYIGHRNLSYVRDFVNAALRKAAQAFVEAYPDTARNRGVILRPIYPKLDLGLADVYWSFSIGSTSPDERSPITLVSVTVPDRKVYAVYGVRIFDANPIIQHIGFKRGTAISPLVDVSERDENGYLFFRGIPVWKRDDTMEILVTAHGTGTLRMAILGIVAEPSEVTADWLEG